MVGDVLTNLTNAKMLRLLQNITEQNNSFIASRKTWYYNGNPLNYYNGNPLNYAIVVFKFQFTDTQLETVYLIINVKQILVVNWTFICQILTHTIEINHTWISFIIRQLMETCTTLRSILRFIFFVYWIFLMWNMNKIN